MFDKLPVDKAIESIFRNRLKIETYTTPIDALNSERLRNRIDYRPYYQRNYVWKRDKASYFIESILLGTEIPPLIFFRKGRSLEVVDGRQRFETVVRFMNNDFRLSRKGLRSLRHLAQRKFESLPNDVRSAFMDTTLRIIEIEVVATPEISESHEDMVKKEIFRRYNSGITPLRKFEIQKAEYIDDPLTQFLSDQLMKSRGTYEQVVDMFMPSRYKSRLEDPELLDETMVRVRELLVLHKVPIRYFHSQNGRETARIIYEDMSANADETEVYEQFVSRLKTLDFLRTKVFTREPTYNRHLYQVLFWCLAVLDEEGVGSERVASNPIRSSLAAHVNDRADIFDAELTEIFNKSVIERYSAVGDFFSQAFDLDVNEVYVQNTRRVSITNYRSGDESALELSEFANLRLNKPDAQTIPVDSLRSRMQRGRFLVRPPYQRRESSSRSQASSIIESMLLGIKLPPIFVFKRSDGLSEVIDGQQRILSIFGYMQLQFQDERGRMVVSEKDGFRLSNLRVLKELNGKRFDQLDEDSKDKLLDFTLYEVIIDEKLNPGFEPVDLFIRLNNKPYPINPNSFEMWNSFADRNVVSKVRRMSDDVSAWCFLRADNTRMHNEELFAILTFFEFSDGRGKLEKEFVSYFDRGHIYFRVRSKPELTKLLEALSTEQDDLEDFLAALKRVSIFVKNLKHLLSTSYRDCDLDLLLKQRLDVLFGVERRSQYLFYALWYVLRKLNRSNIVARRSDLYPEIQKLLSYVRDTRDLTDDFAVQRFHERVEEIWSQFGTSGRRLRLSKVEREKLRLSQGELCPLCKCGLYSGDDAEVDHIVPISRGGADALENIQLVHAHCNRVKGNQLD